MIRRVRDRRTFERLHRHGTRIRRPDLWCSWCPDPDLSATPTAFAIGRACGPAVVRNRLRRRLRSLLREIDRTEPLPSGLLLIGARPSAVELTFEELRVEVSAMVERCRTVGSRC